MYFTFTLTKQQFRCVTVFTDEVGFSGIKDWENYQQITKNYYFKYSFHFRLDDDLTWKTLLHWKKENCFCDAAFSQTESMWRHVPLLFVYIKPSDSSSNPAPKCIQTTAKNKRKQGNWRICCQWTCMCAFVCACVCTLPSMAGVPRLQRHYKSHKYHLTPLQQAGFDIKLSSRGVQPFSTIILYHTSGEES